MKLIWIVGRAEARGPTPLFGLGVAWEREGADGDAGVASREGDVGLALAAEEIEGFLML